MSDREAGFTLVEMLVAMALLAIAAGLTLEGFSAARGAEQRLVTHSERLRTVSDAQIRLRERLERMILHARFEMARPYIDVDGTSEQLDFIAPATPGGGSEQERLDLNDAGELILQDEGHAERLLSGVSSLKIAYYGQTAGDSAPAWHDKWFNELSAPELVRVQVDFAAGDRRVWPELIVRPVAQVDGDCVVDADTGVCRGRT